jgi:hypothetical protein
VIPDFSLFISTKIKVSEGGPSFYKGLDPAVTAYGCRSLVDEKLQNEVEIKIA